MAERSEEIIVEPTVEQSKEKLVAEYKKVFQQLINMRPSGTRNKIANALGKNKSFVSQITNPAYSVPIPAKHLETIFTICHFSLKEREKFLKQYTLAHPNYQYRIEKTVGEPRKTKNFILEVPLLDDENEQERVEGLVKDFTEQLFALLQSRKK